MVAAIDWAAERRQRYEQLCIEVRSTDEVSFKLLAALLGGIAVGIGFLLLAPVDLAWGPGYGVSIFGGLVSFGLFRWELRNLQICAAAIRGVLALESQAQGEAGAEPPLPPLFSRMVAPRILGVPLGKAQTEKLIYAVTILLWLALPWLSRLRATEPAPLAQAPPDWLTLAHLTVSVVLVAATALSIAWGGRPGTFPQGSGTSLDASSEPAPDSSSKVSNPKRSRN